MVISQYKLKLLQKEKLSKDVFKLSFEFPKGFDYEPGQFVMIEVGEDEKKFRAYSILSIPSNKQSLDFCIKIIEGGFASKYFKECKENCEFVIKGPFGNFILDKSKLDKEQFFIASGTGITPFYSIIKKYIFKYPNTKFTLLVGAKFREDLLFFDELTELEKNYPNFNFIPTLTKENWDRNVGRVQNHIKDISNKVFYICGLKELVLETKKLLESRGVDEDYIKLERYS